MPYKDPKKLADARARSRAKYAAASYLQRRLGASARRKAAKRLRVLKHYGGDPPCCACCTEHRLPFLTIDHIHGGGTAHRRTDKHLVLWLIKAGLPDGYQVLCWNCNAAKHFVGHCPHEIERAAAQNCILFTRKHPAAMMPTKAYSGDAGYDLYTLEDTTVPANAFVDIDTGVSVALPPRTWGEIRGRSSTVRSKQLLVATGVIDNGWRGPLFAGVWNLRHKPTEIRSGERIAQFIPHPIIDLQWKEVDELPSSDRGERGFGSSGR